MTRSWSRARAGRSAPRSATRCSRAATRSSASRATPTRPQQTNPTVTWHAWNPTEERPPAEAFDGVDGVVNLVGEPINQRWTDEAKQRDPRQPRIVATKNLVDGDARSAPKPPASSSASRRSATTATAATRSSTSRPGPARPSTRRSASTGRRPRRGREPGRHPAGDHPHRPAARRRRRACSAAAAAVQARRRRPASPAAATTCRGSSLADEVGLFLWALDTEPRGRLQRARPQPGDQQGVLEGARPGAAPARGLPVPKLAVKIRFGAEFGEIAATAGQRALPEARDRRRLRVQFTDIDAAMKDALG